MSPADLLARAEALIVASSGVAEWRPLFVLGLQSAVVFVVAAAVVIWVVVRAGNGRLR